MDLLGRHTFTIRLTMRTIIALIFVALSCLLENIDANRTIIVPTSYGDVLGVETDMARIFYGIPFAQPPLGDLRYLFLTKMSILTDCFISIFQME